MGRPLLKLGKRDVGTIVKGYTRKVKPLGLVALAKKIEVSIPVIRRILIENEVTVRGRGRPVMTKKAKK